MRSRLALHEYALVGGILLVYYHILSLHIAAVPYIPLLLLYPAILGLFGLFLYGFRFPPAAHLRLCTRTYQTQYSVFLLALGLMLINGYLRRNELFHLGTELGFFLIFAFFLLVGGHDRVWHVIDRPMTIMVYITFALMITFRDTIASQLMDTAYDPNLRLTNTIAYGLRPMMVPAIYIFIWGCVNMRNRFWKVLQICTIVPLLVTEVGFFQFRSALGVILLAIVLVLLVYPLLQHRRIRPANYILVVLIALIGFGFLIQSDFWIGFIERIQHTRYHQTSIFASRQVELDVFFRQMGPDVIWGRGLGGSFDASSVFIRQENADRWRTVHYGIFSLVLRGGLPFFALILTFFLPAFRRKPQSWYDNPCNTASVLFIPLILTNLAVAPFLVSLSWTTRYLWFALVMARLGLYGNSRFTIKLSLPIKSE